MLQMSKVPPPISILLYHEQILSIKTHITYICFQSVASLLCQDAELQSHYVR